ncbi:MAG: SpoIIE family protein phosphatase [Gemmatimonadota bacterium]
MTRGPSSPGVVPEAIPDAVRETLTEFRAALERPIYLWAMPADEPPHLLDPVFGTGDCPHAPGQGTLVSLLTREGLPLAVELLPGGNEVLARTLAGTVARLLDFDHEVRYFTYEVSERYEEINLLYTISETLGSVLGLPDAARAILVEVCDVMGAQRGSLWVHEPQGDLLHLVASVGAEGLEGPLLVQDPSAVTARVFREGRPYIVQPQDAGVPEAWGDVGHPADSVLSVPIRYTPPLGDARTVGVINLLGHRQGEAFSSSDQKLLSAIASQVGAALENNRLIRESLERERLTRELELAHNLQMKLLPPLEKMEGVQVAGRVEPAESVGGDFYHVLRLKGERIGIMVGDVSSHGFPAALIMALVMSAAAIYASEVEGPEEVLRQVDAAIRDELESTEMYLTLFYGVVDSRAGTLSYSSAGHPHAFQFSQGGRSQRLSATDPPMGIAPAGQYQLNTVAWDPSQDLLLLFTDGLSDGLGGGSSNRGEEVVVDWVSRHFSDPLESIVNTLLRLAPAEGLTSWGGHDDDESTPSDDRTVLLLRS